MISAVTETPFGQATASVSFGETCQVEETIDGISQNLICELNSYINI